MVAAHIQLTHRVIQRKRQIDQRTARRTSGIGRTKQCVRQRPEMPDRLIVDDTEDVIEDERGRQRVRVNDRHPDNDEERSHVDLPTLPLLGIWFTDNA